MIKGDPRCNNNHRQGDIMGFNKELSKKIALETMGTESGPADTQGIEIKSPG